MLGQHRPHDARRHARTSTRRCRWRSTELQPHADAVGEAHDHHQRRRSVAAQQRDAGRFVQDRRTSRSRTVAVGTHGPAGSTPLQNIATPTGGKYYVVTNPKALPRDLSARSPPRRPPADLRDRTADARRRSIYPHEMLSGIDGSLPPITGFVLTTVKENPLVEVLDASRRKPDDARELHDAGQLDVWRWARRSSSPPTPASAGPTHWTEWDNYDKFFSQMIRWSMRPVERRGQVHRRHRRARTARSGWSSRRSTRTTSSSTS